MYSRQVSGQNEHVSLLGDGVLQGDCGVECLSGVTNAARPHGSLRWTSVRETRVGRGNPNASNEVQMSGKIHRCAAIAIVMYVQQGVHAMLIQGTATGVHMHEFHASGMGSSGYNHIHNRKVQVPAVVIQQGPAVPHDSMQNKVVNSSEA